MSELTLDEAIKHCLEVAEEQERKAQFMGRQFVGTALSYYQNKCFECAADHRQLTEWLTDYKELKNSIGAVKLSDIKEALELIRDYKADNIEQKKLIAEYKRLLKSAIDEWHIVCEWGDCSERCDWFENGKCTQEWRYKAEALKLIGDESNEV